MTTSVISMHPLQTQPVDACHKVRFTLSVTSAVLLASFNAYADSSAIDLGTPVSYTHLTLPTICSV